jgi:hypothetical protein
MPYASPEYWPLKVNVKKQLQNCKQCLTYAKIHLAAVIKLLQSNIGTVIDDTLRVPRHILICSNP